MRKNIWLYATIIILLVFDIIFMYKYKTAQTVNLMTLSTLYPYVQKYQFLESTTEQNIRFAHSHLPNVELFDKIGNKLKIQDLIDSCGGRAMILRVAERYCHTCVDYCVETFLNEKINSGIPKIVLFGYRQIMFEKKLDEYDKIDPDRSFNCQELDTPIEYDNFPYLMVVNSNLEIEYCYFPNKGYPEADIENINIIIDGFAKKTKNK